MFDPNLVILYVDSAPKSAEFYSGLFQRKPVEASPGFAMFALDSGIKLGLWTRATVAPAVNGTAGSSEIVFPVADRHAVDSCHSEWRGRGLPIAQAPTDMEFGRTFVALDPDGHRLRVFTPAQAA